MSMRILPQLWSIHALILGRLLRLLGFLLHLLMDIIVREFDRLKDSAQVERLEKQCEAGSSNEVSLFTDLMGDPLSRVRHCPVHIMLVAEYGAERKIAGLIRGCVKTVSCGSGPNETNDEGDGESSAICVRAAYILGLRVSTAHRRKGVGLKLVQTLEEWFKSTGADYAYMATEKDNEASIKLFTEKCSYKKFRTLALLVHPVHAHCKKIKAEIEIKKLDPTESEVLYRSKLGKREFFPLDIDSILTNRLSLGTWVAYQANQKWPEMQRNNKNQNPNQDRHPRTNNGYSSSSSSAPLPESWAVVSVWNSSDIFKLQVKGVSKLKYMYATTSRFFDKIFPCLRIPSVPDVFRPFGVYFLYGFYAEGPNSAKLVLNLFSFVHNLAKDYGCRLIATEVAGCDPVRGLVPYWDCFSCTEDIWCMKKLNHGAQDWAQSASGLPLFVDPRDF